MPSKLTQVAGGDIELQLKASTPVDIIANAFRISQSQVYEMRENPRHFGRVAPDPAEFHVQSRPRLVRDASGQATQAGKLHPQATFGPFFHWSTAED
jgi:hypothetical protein